jgi:hypothetical protein
MKRIIIICEGLTEKEFCEKVLAPYLWQHEIDIQTPLIKISGGGIVKWDYLRRQVETHLKESSSVFVSTLIDYYGLYQKYNFPRWEEGNKIYDKDNRMSFLEEAMNKDVSESLQHRFIPYLQLHEFEALLFINLQIFYEQVPKSDLVGIEELEKTFTQYSNPEMINNSKVTSPGHRLERIIKGYKKPLYGHYLAEAIGVERIRSKCPRFNNWVQTLITI